jgi:PAS domain S-box-containing protein
MECQPTICLTSSKNSPIHVLHVDDEPSFLEISKQILMDISNFEIDCACSVDEALKIIVTKHYDVIVSDYEMHNKNGLQFLKELREAKNEVPFVLFTGKGREEVAIKALNLGVDRYFTKEGYPETVYGELVHGIIQLVSQKSLSQKLSAEEERFKQLFSNIPMAIAIYQSINEGEDFVFKDINSVAEKIEKIKKNAVLGKRVTDVFPGVKNFGILKVFQRVFNTGQAEYFPVALYQDSRDTGSWRENWVFKLPNDNIVAIYNDITDRKKAEELLRTNQEALKAIVLNAPLGIATSDSNMLFQSANDAFCRILGYSESELQKLTFREITCSEDIKSSNRLMAELVSGKTSFFNVEKRYIRKDGAIIDGRATVSAMRDKTGKPVLFIAELEDITEHRKAKRELEESEERYRSLFEQAPIPVAITTLDGSIFDANLAMQTFTGHSLKELTKTSIVSFYQNPEERKKLIEIIERDSVVADFFTLLKDKNNNSVDVVLNVSKFQIGKETFLRTTIQDVSDRAKAEETLNQIMDQLVLVNEKLGVVGSLTIHDVRNKLSTINGYAYLLKKKHFDQADIVEGLGKIEQAVKDSVKIFEFAKMYEQLGVEELTYVDVEKMVNEAVSLFSGFNLKMVNECHGLRVFADSFLRQLFYNFMDNSRKYGKKATTIRVHFESADSGELQMIYEDDGVGISSENKSKLFSEGFSTGGSTGYGLFLIMKMVDVYGWAIQETGEPGKGVRFIITVPEKNKSGKANYQIQV